MGNTNGTIFVKKSLPNICCFRKVTKYKVNNNVFYKEKYVENLCCRGVII